MVFKFNDVPLTSSFKRDKRPSWYSTRVCKAAGGRNFPNPSAIGYGRGIRLWMFLVPQRDIRADEVRECVETRRRHEAMFTGNTVHHFPRNFSRERIFGLLIARVFQKHLATSRLSSLTTSTICLPKQHQRRPQILLIPYGKPTMIARQTVSNLLMLSCSF